MTEVVHIPAFTRVRNGVEHTVPAYERKKPRPRWTRESIIAAMQKWTELYDEVPGTIDWNPAMARLRGEPQRQVRYLNGAWPATATVVRHFGSWTAAVQAAGLEARTAGPRDHIACDPNKLSRRNLNRLRTTEAYANCRIGPAEFAAKVRAVAKAEKEGVPELLQDALIDLAAVAVAWADRADR